MKIHFNKIMTSSFVKLTPEEGLAVDFNQQQMKDGAKNFILDSNSSVKVNIVPGNQIDHLGNSNAGFTYSPNEYQTQISELGLNITQVICAHSNTTFVCEDETIYGIGEPITYDKKYDTG